MHVELDTQAVEAINRILNKGNKAVIQRSKNGVIVMEERRKIQYRSDLGNLSQQQKEGC